MASSLQLPLLQQVRVASACPMRWEEMAPVGEGDRTRHCGRCNLDVHNLSNMSEAEAEALLATKRPGVRLCAGWYRRADGTVMTRDCPVGLRAARARLARLVTRAAAAAALLMTGAAFARSREREGWMNGLASSRPFMNLAAWLRGQAAPPAAAQQWLAGDICVPAPSSPPAQGGS